MSFIDRLYASTLQAMRLVSASDNGMPVITWSPVGLPFKGRLDLTFIRAGRDVLPPLEAGRAPDRIGVLFCDPAVPLQAGDRVRCVAGPQTGTFAIDEIPTPVAALSKAHHLEIGVREVAQVVAGG